MASGLLKYVGRSTETPPTRGDEGMNDRIKARMEKMGMIETEGPQRPERPTRGGLSQASSNRQMIADQARVTPRSLNLSQGADYVPAVTESRWKAPSSNLPPPQTSHSPSETHHDLHDDGDDGGMFDTDAENLDSTTNLSEGADQTMSRSWHQDIGELTDISGSVVPDGSGYEESLPPKGENALRRTQSEENITNDPKVEILSSEDGDAYQESIDSQPQYALEEVHDLLHNQRHMADYARIAHSPMSTHKAIDSVMESPSIQQSLAYRTMAGRPKNIQTSMPPVFGVKNLEIKVPSLDVNQKASLYQPGAQKLIFGTGIKARESSNTEKTKQIDQNVPAEDSFGAVAKQQTEEFQDYMPRPPTSEPMHHAPQMTTLEKSTSQSRSRNEMTFAHSVSVGQRSWLQAGDEPAAQDRKEEAEYVLPTFLMKEQSSLGVPRPQPIPSLQGKTHFQNDVPNPLPAQRLVPDSVTSTNSDMKMPQSLNTKRLANPGTPDLTSTKKMAVITQKNIEPRKRSFELDYSPAELSRMTYKLLKTESFDHIPKPSVVGLPCEPAEATLTEKLQHTYNLKEEDDEHHSQRRAIFSNLTIEQYEDTGDLLLAKFADVIGRYKEARRTKRMVARELEQEIAQREELVRAKTAAVDRDLVGLKSAGRKVVQGKYT